MGTRAIGGRCPPRPRGGEEVLRTPPQSGSPRPAVLSLLFFFRAGRGAHKPRGVCLCDVASRAAPCVCARERLRHRSRPPHSSLQHARGLRVLLAVEFAPFCSLLFSPPLPLSLYQAVYYTAHRIAVSAAAAAVPGLGCRLGHPPVAGQGHPLVAASRKSVSIPNPARRKKNTQQQSF